MKRITLLSVLLFADIFSIYAQQAGDKKTAKQVLEEIPEALIAQPDAGPDTNANKLINDNLSIEIPPIWREKGMHTLAEFKLTKTDKEPLDVTFPPRKITQSLTITMSTFKKTAEEKKQTVLLQIKNHLLAYHKEVQVTLNQDEIAEKMITMTSSSEVFTTNAGRQGEIYCFNDIETNQSTFIILFLLPGDKPNTSYFVQFNYTRYTYETTLPEDIMEQKTFVYPDDQQSHIDFTKKILKTFNIK